MDTYSHISDDIMLRLRVQNCFTCEIWWMPHKPALQTLNFQLAGQGHMLLGHAKQWSPHAFDLQAMDLCLGGQGLVVSDYARWQVTSECAKQQVTCTLALQAVNSWCMQHQGMKDHGVSCAGPGRLKRIGHLLFRVGFSPTGQTEITP